MVAPTLRGFFPNLLNIDVVQPEFGIDVPNHSVTLFAIDVLWHRIEINVES